MVKVDHYESADTLVNLANLIFRSPVPVGKSIKNKDTNKRQNNVSIKKVIDKLPMQAV